MPKSGVECKVKRALISVSDKAGIVDLAASLVKLGVEIISTGGTFKTIKDAGLSVTYISDVTNFPEILDGRVKTLHPAIHGGILARRTIKEHMDALSDQRITPIDMVVVNLYPFKETAKRPDASWDELIENIDIGGPSMVRSAAKNHEDVIIIVNPNDYGVVLSQLQTAGDCPKEERVRLALAAFKHTTEYDACIAEVLAGRIALSAVSAPTLIKSIEKESNLRYGENPGQAASLYRVSYADADTSLSFIDSKQLQGKELSYNNWLDSDGAFKLIQELHASYSDKAAVAIIKHTNPCGAAVSDTLQEAFWKAFESDSVSAFGGIIAVNRPVTAELAIGMSDIFFEVVIAPEYTPQALEVFSAKKNLRLLEVPRDAWKIRSAPELRSVSGGLLVQGRDCQESPVETWKTVTRRAPLKDELEDMAFAWIVAKHVKSNAILLARGMSTVGVGAGQMNRVGAAEIALRQAGEKAKGSVLASDAFFPFSDTVLLSARYGVRAIVQPGGSLKDQESIDASDENGLTMLFTGVRHFKH
ncbi:bifunctional phosphoribosylaminoimidazolecarboxamide formyltransferase/inosine monophosphate cyclohydrolase [Synergistales bacterium]|nr:bifunctional phosphoribosylaminoimidazolecarboxamide formyltransferase/inosine monophosphate cyclohydrolase [Synergistales bacterium]